MKYRMKEFGVTILLLTTLFTIANAQSKLRIRDRQDNSIPRYAIIGNRLYDENDPELASRHIGVLIDKRSFSETNLKIIFALVSKRFPQPQLLWVDAFTSLDDIKTPEEMDLGVTSEMPSSTPSSKRPYLWAAYTRNGDNEFFQYSPKNDRSGNKLVPIKTAKN